MFVVSVACALLPAHPASAGEGGTSHILPGANATLVDMPPTGPGDFIKPMYLNYDGSTKAQLPTAAGVVANVSATGNTFVVGGGHTFETKVLGGATATVAAFLPYSFLDISGNAVAGSSGYALRQIKSSVDGFGDLTVVPVMLAWKEGNWQYDLLVPIYIPTGSYQKGRLGNPGLNYYTFDPVVGFGYSNVKIGFNAMLHMGYAMNTINSTTQYKSGSLLHIDGAVEQILPVGSDFLALGLEAFYFKQVTADSGSGATLGDFEGMTSGLGPVLGYIHPIGKQSLVFEAKWLTELDTRKRLEGDYIWAKAVYKF